MKARKGVWGPPGVGGLFIWSEARARASRAILIGSWRRRRGFPAGRGGRDAVGGENLSV